MSTASSVGIPAFEDVVVGEVGEQTPDQPCGQEGTNMSWKKESQSTFEGLDVSVGKPKGSPT